MKNDPSSLMDDLALLGSFGGFHQPESNGNICSSPTTMTVTIERHHNFDKNRQKLPFHPPPTWITQKGELSSNIKRPSLIRSISPKGNHPPNHSALVTVACIEITVAPTATKKHRVEFTCQYKCSYFSLWNPSLAKKTSLSFCHEICKRNWIFTLHTSSFPDENCTFDSTSHIVTIPYFLNLLSSHGELKGMNFEEKEDSSNAGMVYPCCLLDMWREFCVTRLFARSNPIPGPVETYLVAT